MEAAAKMNWAAADRARQSVSRQEGRTRAEAAFRADMKVESSLLEDLSAKELADLAKLLRRLVLALDRENS